MSVTPPVPFSLTPGDKDSSTWARLKKHLQARLEVLHRELEQTSTEAVTAERRGRIAEVRRLLSLDPNPPPGQ